MIAALNPDTEKKSYRTIANDTRNADMSPAGCNIFDFEKFNNGGDEFDEELLPPSMARAGFETGNKINSQSQIAPSHIKIRHYIQGMGTTIRALTAMILVKCVIPSKTCTTNVAHNITYHIWGMVEIPQYRI